MGSEISSKCTANDEDAKNIAHLVNVNSAMFSIKSEMMKWLLSLTIVIVCSISPFLIGDYIRSNHQSAAIELIGNQDMGEAPWKLGVRSLLLTKCQ